MKFEEISPRSFRGEVVYRCEGTDRRRAASYHNSSSGELDKNNNNNKKYVYMYVLALSTLITKLTDYKFVTSKK